MTSFWTRSYFHCQFSVCFTTRCHHCLWFLYLLYIYKLQDIVPKHPYPWQEYQKKKRTKKKQRRRRQAPMADCPHLWLKLHWDYTHTLGDIYMIYIYIYIHLYICGRPRWRAWERGEHKTWLAPGWLLACRCPLRCCANKQLNVSRHKTNTSTEQHTHTHSQPYSEKEREGERTARTHGQGNTEIKFFLMSICCTDEQGTTNPKSWLPGIKHARSYHCRKL